MYINVNNKYPNCVTNVHKASGISIRVSTRQFMDGQPNLNLQLPNVLIERGEDANFQPNNNQLKTDIENVGLFPVLHFIVIVDHFIFPSKTPGMFKQ